MNKILLILAAFAFSSISWAQTREAPAALGFAAKFDSAVLKEERKIWVHLPYANTVSKDKVPERYPVIYLLDGDANFNAVVAITEHLSAEGRMPPSIVVGIMHPNRVKDLTFGVDQQEFPDAVFGKDVGGGPEFMAYIENELMPYIDSHYATDSYKIFIGHSLGGLSVIHALVHRPSLFNAYVSLDASLWWNQEVLVNDASKLMKSRSYAGKSLYVAMANRLKPGMTLKTVLKDRSESSSLIRANLHFLDYLKRDRPAGLRYQSKFYADENHGSLPLIGEYDALRFIFAPYYFQVPESQLDDPKFDLVAAIETHFSSVSKVLGTHTLPNRALVNQFGYRDLSAKRYLRAQQLFELNTKNYPKDANSYDSLGDLYLAIDNKVKAIEMFQRALQLELIPETKEKLDALLK